MGDPQPSSHWPPNLGLGLERERGCPGLSQHAVHVDPGSWTARLLTGLLTDCHLSVPCRRSQSGHGRSWALHHPPPHCLLASCLPQCQVGEREQNSQPLPGGSRKGFFVFVSVAICVNTSLFWKKNNVKMFCINSELFSCCFFLRKKKNEN